MKIKNFVEIFGALILFVLILALANQSVLKPTKTELQQALDKVTMPASTYMPMGWMTSRPGHIRLRDELAQYVQQHLKGFKERTFEIKLKHRHNEETVELMLVIYSISEQKKAYNQNDAVETPDYVIPNQIDPEDRTYVVQFKHNNRESPYAHWDITHITIVK